MQFGDLKSKSALQKLNSFLENRSYIEGYQPTSADISVFEALSAAGQPAAADFPHAFRWYSHVKSFGQQEQSKWAKGQSSATSAGGAAEDDDDEDVDLFGSDDEADDEEKEKIKQERLKAYAEKKSKKPGPIAKSSIVLDVKPWDDETDLVALEKEIRKIQTDGLIWGPAKLVPVAYGIKKIQIGCVVEDDKVGTDFLEEQITALEDFVQSVDIAAFNKI